MEDDGLVQLAQQRSDGEARPTEADNPLEIGGGGDHADIPQQRIEVAPSRVLRQAAADGLEERQDSRKTKAIHPITAQHRIHDVEAASGG